jgi:hypothetical protein
MSSVGGSSGGRKSVTIWLSPAEWAAADAAAEVVGVETGALIRHAAKTGFAYAAGEVSAGRVRLRGRSSRVPVPVAAAASSRVEDGAVVSGANSKPDPVLPSRPAPDRADLFRRATQR